MRRVSLLSALALLVAPAAGLAQTPPAETPSAGNQAPATESAETGREPGAERTPAAAESTPAVPARSEDRAASAVHTTPAPLSMEARTTPIVELHGYLRSRFELFHNFDLGWAQIGPEGARVTTPEQLYNGAGLPWYRNPDYSAQWCVTPASGAPRMAMPGSCANPLQTSANLRLRLMPEIHPTEFITIHSQIDILDNLVLGSTPEGYYVPSNTRSVWAPLTAFSQTQLAPIFGYNGFLDSIHVRRAWAEITNPTLGQIRFGRMPSHWGLGILANAGNGLDSDYQSTVDRVMYAARFRPLGLFLAAAWDFPSSGRNSTNVVNEAGQGQPVDLSTFDDVHQWVVALGRRMDPDAQRAALARGEWVINGGVYFVYRTQFLSGESQATLSPTAGVPPMFNPAGTFGSMVYGSNLQFRDVNLFVPDIWFQILRRDFRFELEAVYIRGGVGNIRTDGTCCEPAIISQFGAVAQAEYRLLNQRLAIELQGGYASGDPDVEGLNYFNGLQPQRTDRGNPQTFSTFRFHPDYRIDLIFWRTIMRQFASAYYLRPSVSYNFIDEPNGDLFQGRVDVIWSRASEFQQTRGNHADLGVEIDATLRYQSNHYRVDGVEPVRAAPGFYAMLQYGVFFPLGGLGPTDFERTTNSQGLAAFQFQTAQMVRGWLGVAF